ncbi:MAG: PstS family phosphate ABC transporter substrate-binding protein [Pirellula sp.]
MSPTQLPLLSSNRTARIWLWMLAVAGGLQPLTASCQTTAQQPAPSQQPPAATTLRPNPPVVIEGAPYTPDEPVSGELSIVGSTAMQQLAALWMDDFRQIHPDAKATIDCNGSEGTFKKLEAGKNTLGLVSRDITDEELQRWSQESGERLISINVGYDVLALIVHPDNPLRVLAWNAKLGSPLTLAGDQRATKWGELGVPAPLADEPIRFHVLGSTHALRRYANSALLEGVDAGDRIQEHETQVDVLDAVASQPNGLGLVSAHRAMAKKVRPIRLAVSASSVVSPLDPHAVDLGYPLIRKLSLVLIAPNPDAKNPLMEEFLAFILSRSGQEVVCKDGFLPLDGSELSMQQEKLGWSTFK